MHYDTTQKESSWALHKTYKFIIINS
jgi:hypothetical protein